MSLTLLLLCAAPHVVVVQRSLIGVPAPTAAAVVADVRARLEALQLEATVGVACKRAVECLDATASADDVDAAVGVSLAASGRGLSVDLEARGRLAAKLGTWTGTLPTGTTRLPQDSEPFFAALVSALTAPKPPPVVAGPPVESVLAAPAPERVHLAGPLLITGAAAAVVSLAVTTAALALRGPLDRKLAMMPIVDLTRDEANQQVTTVNGLFTGALVAGMIAFTLLGAGLIALLME